MPRTSRVTIKAARNAEQVIGSNTGKRWRKFVRRDQPPKVRRNDCSGCEYCDDTVRNIIRAGFADEWTDDYDDASVIEDFDRNDAAAISTPTSPYYRRRNRSNRTSRDSQLIYHSSTAKAETKITRPTREPMAKMDKLDYFEHFITRQRNIGLRRPSIG